jgi:hypothetical protein
VVTGLTSDCPGWKLFLGVCSGGVWAVSII